jgi:hypothetical protein
MDGKALLAIFASARLAETGWCALALIKDGAIMLPDNANAGAVGLANPKACVTLTTPLDLAQTLLRVTIALVRPLTASNAVDSGEHSPPKRCAIEERKIPLVCVTWQLVA